jgi:hypothetical protein
MPQEDAMKYGTRIGGRTARAAVLATVLVSLSGLAVAQQSSGSPGARPGENVTAPGAASAPSDLMPRDVCQPGDMNPSCQTPGMDQQSAPADRPSGTSGSSGAVDLQERPMPNPETPVEEPDR